VKKQGNKLLFRNFGIGQRGSKAKMNDFWGHKNAGRKQLELSRMT